MEAAIEYYYNMDPGQIAQLTPKQQQPSLSREAVEHLFNRYRDQQSDAILAEGVGRLCDDLEVMLLMPSHISLSVTGACVSRNSETPAISCCRPCKATVPLSDRIDTVTAVHHIVTMKRLQLSFCRAQAYNGSRVACTLPP